MALYTCPKCKKDNLLADEVCFSYGIKIRACKECRRKEQAEYRKINGRKSERKYHLKKAYGLDESLLNQKLEKQLNGCAICKRSFNECKMFIDHDHKTNIVRDILCPRCNNVLGLINDNEILIWKILEYIKRHNIVAA